MAVELIKGKGYQMEPKTLGLPHQKIYVMDQFLPSTNKEWATFFSIMGLDEWVIVRTRVPKDNILSVKNGLITLTEEANMITLHQNEQDRKPLVKEWLNQVGTLIHPRDRDSESFREYFS